MSTPPTLFIKPRRAKPFFMRHPWVFSGAVGRVEGQPEKGDVIAVADAEGRFIGRGLFNPDSQIIVRLVSWKQDEAVDDAFWRGRIESALRLRRDVLRLPESTNAYRLIFSESDGLPGLVVDRYADWLVAQFLTAGMAKRADLLLDLLMELAAPKGIYCRADDEAGEKESMELKRGVARGQAPEGPVEITCDGLKFLVDLAGGQKTGFFLDQRENRLAAARWMKGRTLLDAFCYTGAFAVTASKLGGAARVTAIDRSEAALALARKNLDLNGVMNVEVRPGQVADELRELRRAGRRFGAVVLDPPKFARGGQGVERALRAYRDINLMAMHLLEEDGILVTCSCSGHVGEGDFLMMLNEAASEAGVSAQILERRSQSADHPVIVSCPETLYLKCFILRVNRG
jgi:23S rRNA (cytosine1962-C5)-methyltransferase